MRKNDIPTFHCFTVQTHTFLIKQAPRFTLASGHFRSQDHVQHSLVRLQFIFGHLIRDFFLLERFYKSVLCLLRFSFPYATAFSIDSISGGLQRVTSRMYLPIAKSGIDMSLPYISSAPELIG